VIVRLREEVREGVLHPKKVKMELAHVIVANFHGEEATRKAGEEWDIRFSKRQAPSDVEGYRIRFVRDGVAFVSKKVGDIESSVTWPLPIRVKWARLLVHLGVFESNSEADRLVKQGGLEIDGERIDDLKREIDLSIRGEFLLRAGKKKFLRIVVE